MATLDSTALHEFLIQFTDGFSPELAEHFVSTPPNEVMQARIDELAAKANEDELSEQEQREYNTYIEALDVIALLRIKSMKKIGQSSSR
ncbi:hypothetical protein LF1_34830 [Rubripirellula obstinata]|uniref:Uncharacterized protein n=1 Tax=Rubripirellula obstinata TaxID=406547 RepID=A0A5B1CKV4_9BACT|nr:hypothetical protein [Rubripirellula obstinata]KAA1260941.1 hypothetical protein LF1_34830 [Rubripirellula obstinata]